MILLSKTISKEVKQSEDTSHIKELLEEHKDRFERIGKRIGIQVDLNVDPEARRTVTTPTTIYYTGGKGKRNTTPSEPRYH